MQVCVGGTPGEGRFLDAVVAIAAFDVQLAGMVGMTERYRLLDGDNGAGHVGASNQSHARCHVRPLRK